uniref:Mitochondrial inner membrane protease ATP23 n=1 Tax=Zea mays TaxID=4577 RepID=A0A804MEH1_MAIZE
MAEGNGGSRAEAGVRESSEPSPKRSSIPAMPHEECVEGIRSALKHPTVRFLRERMESAGCLVWPRLIRAATCSSAGGYASQQGIQVCCNHMTCQDEITQVMIHELIHAYDDCVAKNLNWTNCAHHACSEECVKRRALMSVKNNPYCSEGAAKDAIDAVWDICYNDTRPFDRAP